MSDCIFCRIASGEAPSYKVWENGQYVAVLDIFPKIAGQVVVLSKEHRPAYLFALPEKQVQSHMEAAKTVALKMDAALGTDRTAMRMEGLEIEHAHIKLYPVYSTEKYEDKVNLPPKRMSDTELEIIYKKFQ